MLNGNLKPDHPAFGHASLIVLNTLNYTKSERDHKGYLAQHVERTAKTVANNITETLLKILTQPDLPPSPATDKKPQEGEIQETVGSEDVTYANRDTISAQKDTSVGFKM